jgi:hypothetical protein
VAQHISRELVFTSSICTLFHIITPCHVTMHRSPRPSSNFTKLQLPCPNCSCIAPTDDHRRTTLAARGQNTLTQPSMPSASISYPKIQLDLPFRHTKSDDTLKFPQSRTPEPRPRTRSPGNQTATPSRERERRAHQAGGRRTRRRQRRHGRRARGGGGRRPPRRMGRGRPRLRRPSRAT